LSEKNIKINRLQEVILMDNYDTESNHILTKLEEIAQETSDEDNEISKIITSLNDLVRRVGIYKEDFTIHRNWDLLRVILFVV